MNGWADLISSIAGLLWPLLGFAALLILQKPLMDLLPRVRRGKWAGFEIELDKLEKASLGLERVAAASRGVVVTEDGDDEIVASVLREAAQSPKIALIHLAIEIERKTAQTLASLGHSDKGRTRSLSDSMAILDKQFMVLPKHIESTLSSFRHIRNKIIHGGHVDSEETIRAIDSGIIILRALNAVPTEKNIVYHPGVEVFEDALCKKVREGMRGVILETQTPGGTTSNFRIFPSTKTHFKKGERVAWEWDHARAWGESWYRDPDSAEIKRAWESAQEFIGRHLDEI